LNILESLKIKQEKSSVVEKVNDNRFSFTDKLEINSNLLNIDKILNEMENGNVSDKKVESFDDDRVSKYQIKANEYLDSIKEKIENLNSGYNELMNSFNLESIMTMI
jgi:hypothetical protein